MRRSAGLERREAGGELIKIGSEIGAGQTLQAKAAVDQVAHAARRLGQPANPLPNGVVGVDERDAQVAQPVYDEAQGVAQFMRDKGEEPRLFLAQRFFLLDERLVEADFGAGAQAFFVDRLEVEQEAHVRQYTE